MSVLLQSLEKRTTTMSAEEVANVLSVNPKLVYKLAARRELKGIRVGRLLRFDPAAVVAFIRGKS